MFAQSVVFSLPLSAHPRRLVGFLMFLLSLFLRCNKILVYNKGLFYVFFIIFKIYYVNEADREETGGCYLSYYWVHEYKIFFWLSKKMWQAPINS